MAWETIVDRIKQQREFLIKQDSSLVDQILEDIIKSNYKNSSWEERQVMKDKLQEVVLTDGYDNSI